MVLRTFNKITCVHALLAAGVRSGVHGLVQIFAYLKARQASSGDAARLVVYGSSWCSLPSLTMALPARGALRPFKGAQQAPVEHHQAGGAAAPSAPDVPWPTHHLAALLLPTSAPPACELSIKPISAAFGEPALTVMLHLLLLLLLSTHQTLTRRMYRW
jgi:hypothetical protein